VSNLFHENIQDIEIPKSITGKVCIKLHMGESGNNTHVTPEDVKVIFDKVRANGGEPFLLDTTTLYRQRRYTKEDYMEVVREHGFGNFPVVIGSDDDVEMIHGYGIPREILEADALLVLSHGKGHLITAYGGAIKNIGMGCVNKDGKRRIHNPDRPTHISEKCTKCKACIEACPDELIKMDDDGNIKVNRLDCSGCGECVKACNFEAMIQDPESKDISFREFAIAAKAVLDQFPKEKVFYVTVLKNITKWCDCASDPGEIVCPDIGYLSDTDPIKIDADSIRLIKEKKPDALDFETWALFEKKSREVLGGQKDLEEFKQI